MDTTEVQLSEEDKSLLEKLTVAPTKQFVGGGYIPGGSYGSRTNDLLSEIRDVLKDIRDNLVIETSTPANPADETFWDKYKEFWDKLPKVAPRPGTPSWEPWRPYPLPYVGDFPPYYGTWTYAPTIATDHANV